MKKNILSFIATLAFSCSAFGGDTLTANLVEVKTYKGDDGKNIQCKSDRILVQAIFTLPNAILDGIVMAFATKEGNLFLHERNWKIKGTNNLEYGYCASQGYKADVRVRFMNSKGETSNLLNFTVDTSLIDPLEAKEFPVLVPAS